MRTPLALLAGLVATAVAAPPVTQPTTAAEAYARAALLVRVDSPANSNAYDDPREWPPFPPAWHALADPAWTQNADARAMARRAATMPAGPGSAWLVDRPAPADRPSTAVSPLSEARRVANDLADAAWYAQEAGRQNDALDLLDDLAGLARTLRSEPDSDGGAIRLMVAVGIDALRASRLLVIAPGLDFSADAGQPLDRDRVRTLIAALVRHADGRAQWDALGEVRRGADVPDVGRVTKPASDRAVTAIDRVNNEMNFCAVSLACQLYRADTGHWPERGEQLVPKYLAALPPDAADPAAAIGYVLEPGAMPDGTDRPLVVSRANNADGLRHTNAKPLYWFYRGDGGPAPANNEKLRLGQFRDVARWPAP